MNKQFTNMVMILRVYVLELIQNTCYHTRTHLSEPVETTPGAKKATETRSSCCYIDSQLPKFKSHPDLAATPSTQALLRIHYLLALRQTL